MKSVLLKEEEEVSFCGQGLGSWVLDRVGTLPWYSGRWEGDAAATVSSGRLESRWSSSGGSGGVVAWIGGRLVALWASRRLSAARLSLVKSEKFVMAARTGSGRRCNQRVRRMSIFLLLPIASGGGKGTSSQSGLQTGVDSQGPVSKGQTTY